MMRAFTIVLAALLLTACQQGPSPEQLAGQKSEKMKHYSDILQWRTERIERLTKPDGWLSLVGMHWLPKSGVTQVGSGEINGTRLTVGPDKLGLIAVEEGNQVWLEPESGVALTIDGLPVAGRTKLVADSQGTATVVGFNDGKASFIVIERGGKLALRVRDAEAATRVKFSGIDYFPVDKGFRYTATFTPHDAGRTIDIVNILGMVEPMMNPGTVTFSAGEKTFTLEAIDEGDHDLTMDRLDAAVDHQNVTLENLRPFHRVSLYREEEGADRVTHQVGVDVEPPLFVIRGRTGKSC